MTIRFGNQTHAPIRDSEYLPTPEYQALLDYKIARGDHYERMYATVREHAAKVPCWCDFCRVFKETLLNVR